MPTWQIKFQHESTRYSGSGSLITTLECKVEVLDTGIPNEILDAILRIGEEDVMLGNTDLIARLLIRLCEHEGRPESDAAIKQYNVGLRPRQTERSV